MGREIKRVPVTFDWPLDKTWAGYRMPDRLREPNCKVCARRSDERSDGLTPQARAISDTFYPHMIVHAGAWDGAREHGDALAWHDKIGQAEVDNLLAEGRLRTLVKREPTEDNPRDWEWKSLPRTADEVNAEQHGGSRGHDAINRMLLVRFRCKVLGIPMECRACDGHGSVEAYPGQRADAEAWEREEPPTGDGWQLWETVSEGSPISPVFPDAEGLAQWLTTRDSCWGATKRPMTIEQARGFVGVGWAPSGFINAGGVHDGPTFIGTEKALGEGST